MSMTQTLSFAGMAIGVGALIGLTAPDAAYMTVHNVTYNNGIVTADRHVHRETIADWFVTIVPSDKDGPVCRTIQGPGIDEGWSYYKPGNRSETSWPLDVWVGDPGCSERLGSEEYLMLITWTPRDGSQAVVFSTRFAR